jgi:hypothetical protein
MRRLAILATLFAVVLLVVAQFALPAIAENRATDELTKGGGAADVDIDALPAVRLLTGDGDLVRVRARGVTLPFVAPNEKVLDDLDGFGEVDVEVSDGRSGPFRLDTLTLKRDGDGPYRTVIRGTVSAQDLGTFAGGQMGGAFGGFFGGLAGSALPGGDQPVPLDLDATLRSIDGRAEAVVVHGTVAGIPAGPLVEAFAQAVAGGF